MVCDARHNRSDKKDGSNSSVFALQDYNCQTAISCCHEGFLAPWKYGLSVMMIHGSLQKGSQTGYTKVVYPFESHCNDSLSADN
jgi:hypothetical protein